MSHGLCTSCGAAVNLTAGQDQINCTFCGTLVKRPEAEAQFTEVKNSKFGGTLLLAQMALKNADYKEALGYYNKIIEQNEKEAEAWFGKAACYAADGNYINSGFIQSCKTAIALAIMPEPMGKRLAQMIAENIAERLKGGNFTDDVKYWRGGYAPIQKCHMMLGLATEWDPMNGFLAAVGFDFYARALRIIYKKKLELKNYQLLFLQGKNIDGTEAYEFGIPSGERRQYRSKMYRRVYGEDEAALAEFESLLGPFCEKHLQNMLATTPESAKSVANEWRNSKLIFNDQHQKITQDIAQLETRSVGEFDEIIQHFKDGKCFIATACYGDYDHPIVMELRNFRDNYLETSAAGQAFVRNYYKWSPPVANFIVKNATLKALARVLIVVPALAVARIIGIIFQQK